MAEQEPEQQQPGSRLGDSMMFGLIEHTEKIEEAMAETQRVLTQRIQELGQLQNWAVQASVELQKQATAAIKSLEAERVKLQAVAPALQQNAVWAMRETLREQAGQIKYEMRTEVRDALAEPLKDIEHGARHVRQNVKDTKILTFAIVLLIGFGLGLGLGYVPVRRSIVNLEEHVTTIDQYLGAQQQAAASAAKPVPVQDHKKGK
jgi:hypothetical protein